MADGPVKLLSVVIRTTFDSLTTGSAHPYGAYATTTCGWITMHDSLDGARYPYVDVSGLHGFPGSIAMWPSGMFVSTTWTGLEAITVLMDRFRVRCRTMVVFDQMTCADGVMLDRGAMPPRFLRRSVGPNGCLDALIDVFMLAIETKFDFSPGSVTTDFVLLHTYSDLTYTMSLFVTTYSCTALMPIATTIGSFAVSIF